MMDHMVLVPDFFISFKEKGDSCIPVLITNKHVIKNSNIGHLVFTKASESNNPIDNEHTVFNIHNFEKYWKMHPENDVDICAMAINPFISDAAKNGHNFFYLPIPSNCLATDLDFSSLSAIENIIMIGYPNGLWDEENNKPLFRQGITATHPKYDFNGKREFLIDAACFPGSSGSPVFIINEGMYFDQKTRIVHSNDRVILLGVLYAGPQQSIVGSLEVYEIPVVQKVVSLSNIPINLGIIIKSNRIKELELQF